MLDLLLADGAVRVERDVGVHVRDGVRLSVDIYRPNRPGRFPALLEHIPYRKDDLRALQDRGESIHLVQAGFACVRLDVRGTGSSGGVAEDEYTDAEQRDGVEVVDWISCQPWCSGAVGAWGKSYGGFSAIQLAARRPPALRAIVPVYATDNRYTDDMHFDGGALCAFELANYPVRMIAMNALPPDADPAEPGRDEAWRERIDQTPPWILRWLREQHDGPYWRNGSLAPDYQRIEVPVMIVAGWRDGYRTAGLRMAQRLGAPWRLLAGPWAHFAPDQGIPGPRYPFLHLLTGFFAEHLGGPSAGTQARPRSVFFVGEHDSPSIPHEQVSGTWWESDRWPAGCTDQRLRFAGADDAPASVAVGAATGNWCPPPPETGLFCDQRADDARSACHDSGPLQESISVLGNPHVRFGIAHPGPRVIVVVKLNDVSPEGESQPVTRGAVNLDCHSEPTIDLDLMATGWRFRPGHRIRISVAVNDWPCLWPLPTLAPLRLTSPIELTLPGLPDDLRTHTPLGEPVPVTFTEAETESSPPTWRIVHDAISGRSGIEAADSSVFEFPSERVRCEEHHTYSATIVEYDPQSARVSGTCRFLIRTPTRTVETQARGTFTATDTEFQIHLELDVLRDGAPFHHRSWDEQIRRQGR